ncbi:MAG: ATP-binding protein [Acidobacteriota bacterium]
MKQQTPADGDAQRGRRSLTTGLIVPVALASAVSAAVVITLQVAVNWPPWLTLTIAAAGGVGLGGWLLDRLLRPVRDVVQALQDGVASLRDGDFSMRLAVTRTDDLGDLVTLYNQATELLRTERATLRQREMLLDTALQSSPTAVILVDPTRRVVFSNQEARRLLTGGRRLEGLSFDELLAGCPPAMRAALADDDGLFTVDDEAADAARDAETFHASRRRFRLDRRPYDLVLLRRLTDELSREEAKIWKHVIRIMSHELNNSLAPVASLVHSAGLLAERGDRQRLQTVLSGVEERVRHVAEFLAGYARYARLPPPEPEEVAWRPFLERLRRHTPFRLEGEPGSPTGIFDPAQMEQVLINLLKNAREATEVEPPADDGGDGGITVRLSPAADGATRLEVLDRGRGMDARTLERALLPFFTTKPDGVGVGLPLCRDILAAHGGRLSIRRRPGDGTAVVCWLPPPDRTRLEAS